MNPTNTASQPQPTASTDPASKPAQAQQLRYIKLSIKYQKSFSQTVQVNPKQSLAELKQYLSQSTLFHIYDNFHFEAGGKSLPQYAELDSIFPADSDLDIVIDPYDERTSRYHVRRVQELIRNPLLWAVFNYKESKPREQPIIKQKDLNIETSLQPSFLSPLYTQPQTQNPKQCVQFVNYSGYNPPPAHRRLNGDLFYLHTRTLQGIDYHITANPRGFYINNSNINFFDPNPHPTYGRVFSSLFDLLTETSGRFKKAFEEVLENAQLSEVERVAQASGARNREVWLQRAQQISHKWNGNRLEEADLEINSVKDWNEMFQTQAILPAESTLERLNKSKMFFKIYTEFLQAATSGAKALVQGKMAPLNPLDDKLQHIYIHNSIFYSIAQQTPLSFCQQKGLDATPTVSAVNSDLRNLSRLLSLSIPELHVLHMALIEYRGYRIIAQCIIPGILTADQLQCSQYGSIDDGKTISDNKEFEFIMVKVCERMGLDSSVEFMDEKGVRKRIAGSIQVKGILGSDKRKYILDLMRLSPRDYNWGGSDGMTCVLREELIDQFKDVYGKNTMGLTVGKELDVKINVNLETGVEFTKTDQTEKQQEQLKNMAKFLRQTCIPKLITSLAGMDKRLLSDSNGISKAFHKHGVNMRYLGQVYSHKLTAEHPQIKVALQRVILVKSAKHLFRMAMRETSPMQISVVLARLLNCLFGSKGHLQMIEENKFAEVKKEQASEEVAKKTSKKKKANKQAKPQVQQGTVDCGIVVVDSPYLNIKPSQIWQKIQKIAQARYRHQFPDKIQTFAAFTLPFNKLATLRDLCLTLGLKIQQRQYPIFSNKDLQQLPFQPQNILQLQAITKHIPLEDHQTQKLIESADVQLNAFKVEEAIELYNTAVQYMIGLYGSLHRDIAAVHHKIATIYYRLGDYEAAIGCETNSLEILRLLFGQDNVQTIQSLSNIGLFHFSKGDRQKALFYLYKSLFLCNFSFGESYPQAIVNYMNISAIYQQNKQFQLAIACMLETLERIIRIYGKDNLNTAACYTGLATLHYEISDLRQCIDYQEKSVNVLKHAFKETDPRLVDAVNLLNYYKEVFSTKKAQDESSIKKTTTKREGGQQQQRQQVQQDNPERAMLLKKLQQAKWNSRFHR